MKITLLIAIGLAFLIFGEWIYRGFIRPIEPLSIEVQHLSKYLNEKGFKGSPYAVRHGFRHSYMLSSAAFKIEDYPLPIAIAVHPSIEISEKSTLSNAVHDAIYNGNLVISFPAWGEGTELMRGKIKDAFKEYKL